MTSRILSYDEIHKRYETHTKKTLSLYVTRQDQEFVIANDTTVADLELIRSTIELVGEPGFGNGTQYGGGVVGGAVNSGGLGIEEIFPVYGSTLNYLYSVMNTGVSTVDGSTQPNAIVHKSCLNHGWANVKIDGITQARSFMRDDRYSDNDIDILVPTDYGLLANRAINAAGPSHTLKLENIQLEPRVRVKSTFVGCGTPGARRARFVEDFADTDVATYREPDKSVKYFVDDSKGECQIPANMITCLILQFQMTPRSTL